MRKLNIIGVDISESSVKVLQLDEDFNITSFGTAPLESGVVHDGSITNKEAFAVTIKEVLKNTKPEILFSDGFLLRTVVSLPESKIYTHTLEVPQEIENTEIHTYVYDDAKKIIPFDLDSMYWDFRIVDTNGVKNATFVGVPKVNLDSYVEALTYSNLKPALIVGELFSLASVLLPQSPLQENYMIIDIGAFNTNIGVFTADVIADISLTLPFGGEHITAAIAEKLNCTKEEAEVIKKESNIHEPVTKKDVNTSKILEESIREIVEAILKTCEYMESKNNQSIQHIIIAGGTALLPGLAPYLNKLIGIETVVADPLSQIKNREILDKTTHEIFFANVVGLALQSKNVKAVGINLLTQYRYNDDQTQKEKLSIRDIRTFEDFKYVLFVFFDTLRNILFQFFTTIFKQVQKNMKLILTSIFLLLALLFLGWVITTYTYVIS